LGFTAEETVKWVSRLIGRSIRSAGKAACTVESLEPRRLLSANIAQPLPNASFPQGISPRSIDLSNFLVDNATFASDLTYKATSDAPALINPAINGSILTLTVSATSSGFAHVRVVGTDPMGAQVIDQIRLQVTASADRSLDVPLGAGHDTFRFTESNGTGASITLNGPGTGVIHMGGDNLVLHGDHARGSNQEIESVTLTGTTAASTLTIRGHTAHKSAPVIGNITSDGALDLLRMRKITLLGDLTLSGAVRTVQMDSASDGTITAGASVAPMHMQIGTFVDENFSSPSPIKVISAVQLVSTDNVPETFVANYVHRLTALGSFDAGLQLSGMSGPHLTLNNLRIGGNIGGAWNIAGASVPITASGALPDFNGTFASVARIRFINSFQGSLTVPSLNLLRVGGTMSAALNLTAPSVTDLGRLMVTGPILNSSIIAAGSIGPIHARALQRSIVFAGVGNVPQGQPLPVSATDFSSSATIQSITLRPTRKVIGFSGSDIAAANIGSLDLGNTRVSNGGIPFGVAAMQIGHLSVRDLTHRRTLTFSQLHDPAAIAAFVTAHGIQLDDFVIRLI
jgi:hypothetical protein